MANQSYYADAHAPTIPPDFYFTVGQTSTITGLLEPKDDSEAANKGYIDTQIITVTGQNTWKIPVKVSSISNIDISIGGLQTVDGILVLAGDRVLLKDQIDSFENGIYVANIGSWTRPIDSEVGNVATGVFVYTETGNVNEFLTFACETTTFTGDKVYFGMPLNFIQYITKPGLPLNSLQFNSNGNFEGTPSLIWSQTSNLLTMSGGRITGLATPSPFNLTDVANVDYVNGQIGSYPGGTQGSLQFNYAGLFSGSPNLLWSGTTMFLSGSAVTGPTNGALNINGAIDVTGKMHMTGDLVSTGNMFANNFLTTSDILKKTDIKPLKNSIETIDKIGCYSYRMEHTQDRVYGILAQELEEMGLGNLVYDVGEYKSVAYGQIIALLINSIQDLKMEIDFLKDNLYKQYLIEKKVKSKDGYISPYNYKNSDKIEEIFHDMGSKGINRSTSKLRTRPKSRPKSGSKSNNILKSKESLKKRSFRLH
jgi:hypothetical protein